MLPMPLPAAAYLAQLVASWQVAEAGTATRLERELQQALSQVASAAMPRSHWLTPEDSEDLQQRALEKVWMCLKRRSVTPGNEKAFTWRVTVNEFNSWYQRRRRERDYVRGERHQHESQEGGGDHAIDRGSPTPEQVLVAQRLQARLKKAIEALPPAERRTFEAHYYGGMDQETLARVWLTEERRPPFSADAAAQIATTAPEYRKARNAIDVRLKRARCKLKVALVEGKP